MTERTNPANDSKPTTATSKAPLPRRRLHASTYVVLLLAATMLCLLNVPGGRHITFDGLPDRAFGSLTRNDRIQHGWPWKYLVRQDVIKAIDSATGDLQTTSLWSFNEDFVSFSGWSLAGDLAVAAAVLAAVGFAFERWRRHRKAIWQLTIVDLLATTAAIAGTTAYLVDAARVHTVEAEILRNQELTNERGGKPPFSEAHFDIVGPHWLRDLTGEMWPTWFDRIVWLAITPKELDTVTHLRDLRAIEVANIDPSDERVAALSKLTELEAILLHVNQEKTHSDELVAKILRHIRGLERLETLHVDADAFGKESAEVVSTFPRLRTLVIQSFDHFGDESLAALSRCQSLEVIAISWTMNVTSRGVRELSALPHLHFLDLGMTNLGDDAIDELKSLRKLEELRGTYYGMSPDGIARFAEFPKVRRLGITVDSTGWGGVERGIKAARPDIVVEDWPEIP